MIILISSVCVSAQSGGNKDLIVTNEIGVLLGPTFLQTDYGESGDFNSDTSNFGIGFGIVYIADFSPSRYKSRFFNHLTDHIKARIELSFLKVDLEHNGNVIEAASNSQSDRFIAMKGETKLFNIGLYTDYHIMSLKANNSKFQPFLSLGLVYTSATPQVVSPQDSADLPNAFQNLDPKDLRRQSVISIAYGLGTRYKLKDVDFLIDARFHPFSSDKIDGIDTQISGDKNNDTQVVFNFGVIFQLN